jgi:hypothetical protein
VRKLLALLTILAIAGCSSVPGSSTVGVLGTTPTAGFGCVPMTQQGHPYHWVVDGWDELQNKGNSPATITKVELTGAHGVTLTKARVAPIIRHGSGTVLVGVMPGGPDSRDGMTAVAKSQPAVGAVIKPGQTLNLLLWLQVPNGGRIGPPQVTYTDDAGSHVWTSGSQYGFAPGLTCPRSITGLGTS